MIPISPQHSLLGELTKVLVVYTNAIIEIAFTTSGLKGECMFDFSWIDMGLLASSGAIGSLLVWGYQNWLKK
jgi:hypothetical protein